MNNLEPSQTAASHKDKASLFLAVLMPALFMAVGAVALALVQWRTQQLPIPAPVPVAESPPEPAKVEVPKISPVVADKLVEIKKEEPLVSAVVLERKKARLAKLTGSKKSVEIRSAAATQRAVENLSALMEKNRDLHLDALSVDASTSELKASQAKLDALEKRQAQIQDNLKKITTAPKPPREALSGFSPVAKPAKGVEYHFEVADGRIAYIDLEKLLEAVKQDVQVRVRLSGSPRGIRSEVGPVGDFRLAYEIGVTVDPLGGSSSFGLKGWEIIPAVVQHGETAEQIVQPLSKFQRVIKTLSPTQATITLWVYPSGFETFRQVRDLLHAQGFMVAARPLPEGIPVRGSPGGSLSAGQ